MKGSRRDFLKTAGITAIGSAGLGIAGLRIARAEEHAAEAAQAGDRYAMLIDLPKWINNTDAAAHQRCFDACHRAHNVPDLVSQRSPVPAEERDVNHEIKWIWTEQFENAFPVSYHAQLAEAFRGAGVPVLCNHCENPSCVRVCPTQATWQREDGIVMMDMHRCIGCRYCIVACPYGSRSFNFRDPRDGFQDPEDPEVVRYPTPDFPSRMRGVVEKCNFCVERLADGRTPACVEALGEDGALTFGRLSDSHVQEALNGRFTIRRKPELGTEPHVFYIVA